MSKKFFINDAEEIIPPVNDSPYKRILAIGDVHAAFDKLMSLWEKLDVRDDDAVIFLGDYLYGMRDKNLDTLLWLVEHGKRKNITFLRGNSDAVSLRHLFNAEGKIFRGLNRRLGVAIKIAAVKNPYLPQEIFNFLNNLPLCHCLTIGGRKYFFCHAGINVNAPLKIPGRNILLLDTRAKEDGRLSCVDILSGEIYGSDF